ncbi:hypothetical protein T4E_12261 [Trichinella pseudospiralis]|uniref:PiggyBac transposable element-derived protein domain-containing protein n=1 Tax=Trichinella pseudospiralis TaxID=6337 RepID=A0A0V0YJ06_TRIPS|nr:hypothetical protein T4E_12261 [Trichinella pseudospiralis]
MSSNRFHQLKRFLHFADNQNLFAGDKVSKISPLYKTLNNSLVQHALMSLWCHTIVDTAQRYLSGES